MKRTITFLFALVFGISCVFRPPAAAQEHQMRVVKRVTKRIIHGTHTRGRGFIIKVHRHGKTITKRVWVKSKRITKRVVRKTRNRCQLTVPDRFKLEPAHAADMLNAQACVSSDGRNTAGCGCAVFNLTAFRVPPFPQVLTFSKVHNVQIGGLAWSLVTIKRLIGQIVRLVWSSLFLGDLA